MQNFIKVHEISWTFMKFKLEILDSKFHKNSWNSTQNFRKNYEFCKSSWNFMKFYEISRTFMKFKFEILNSKFHKSSWNYMQNFIKVHEISSFIGPK